MGGRVSGVSDEGVYEWLYAVCTRSGIVEGKDGI